MVRKALAILALIGVVFTFGFCVGRESLQEGPTPPPPGSTPEPGASLAETCAQQARQARERVRAHEAPGLADEMYGPCAVTRVVDGDTVDVVCGNYQDRVRLLNIDTPERGHPDYRPARDALENMVQGRDVYLVFETPGVPNRGGYDRLLAYLFVDGTNINVEMVRQGWSEYWTKYGRSRFEADFLAAE